MEGVESLISSNTRSSLSRKNTVQMTRGMKARICRMKNEDPKMTIRQIRDFMMREHNLRIGATTIRDTLRDLDYWLCVSEDDNTCRVQNPVPRELERTLYQWYMQKKSSQPISDQEILQQAHVLGNDIVPGLIFTSGWLIRWKQRRGLNRNSAPVPPTFQQTRQATSVGSSDATSLRPLIPMPESNSVDTTMSECAENTIACSPIKIEPVCLGYLEPNSSADLHSPSSSSPDSKHPDHCINGFLPIRNKTKNLTPDDADAREALSVLSAFFRQLQDSEYSHMGVDREARMKELSDMVLDVNRLSQQKFRQLKLTDYFSTF